jgi:hypothetical protein
VQRSQGVHSQLSQSSRSKLVVTQRTLIASMVSSIAVCRQEQAVSLAAYSMRGTCLVAVSGDIVMHVQSPRYS